jgi:DNA-binding transcriptional ArsR family regulator
MQATDPVWTVYQEKAYFARSSYFTIPSPAPVAWKWDTPSSQEAPYILKLEYTDYMLDALRRFKADIFHALAHPTRIAIVEALRGGELSAGKLIEQLGLEQANASQHLTVLRTKHILVNRKAGNQVFYSLRDPALIEVLDILRRYFYSQLAETKSMLEEVGQQEVVSK